MLSGVCPADLSELRYPVLVSPKLDGVRAIRLGNRLVSRTLKDIPNKYVRNWCIEHLPEGLDGELLLRDWTAPFSDVSSAIMSIEGEPDFVFAAFDVLSLDPSDGRHFNDEPFEDRFAKLEAWR